jgi:putative endonuclease
VTSFLIARVYQHKTHADSKSFTAKYDCSLLVYYEEHDHIDTAIAREKQIKSWKRQKKIDLITKDNPEWRDLYEDVV